jgi:uncharacterized protein YyaL (SSP411 family)
MPNSLAAAASPYLRQHQDNPVDWMEWGDAAFARARAENKLLLISSGYAACHWCHVMAHECFESEEIAAIMNREFVCIKVDREERPDVDQVYLDAVQAMTGRGGWPLNCFVLPDGRPVYGGTYFPREHWRALLENLSALHRDQPDTIAEQAEKITARLRQMELRGSGATARDTEAPAWPETVASFFSRFDTENGGTGQAPKFPMPCEWAFLLRYGVRTGDAAVLKQVRLTLDRMASGGIHDPLAGGFARYSVDAEWKVPHFEKMLYDNAQLLQLYAEGYAVFGDPAYRAVARGIADFVENELNAPGVLEGAYCSALDADSEGEEGLFYVWTRAELATVLGSRLAAFADLFGVHVDGDGGEAHWEEGRHVLLRRYSIAEWGVRHGWTEPEAQEIWEQGRGDLLAARARRERPMRDDKVLAGWNGLMLGALASASRLVDDPVLLKRARRCAEVLLAHARRPDGGLWRRGWEGAFGIDAFLEDYACLARGLIALYQATFEERWLLEARSLADYALAHCADPESPLLFFAADNAPKVLVRKKEMQDNVIPSSNALMAEVLFLLADYFVDPALHARGAALCAAMRPEFPSYAPAYAHWAGVMFLEDQGPATLAVAGPDVGKFLVATTGRFLPHLRLAGSAGVSKVPLLEGKFSEDATVGFRCEAGTCGLPVADWNSLLAAEERGWMLPA